MRIAFSPQRADEPDPTLSVSGDVLTLNGDVFDFADLTQPGDTLPGDAIASAWILGARNDAGVTEVTIRLPYGKGDEARAFAKPITVISGEVPLP